MKVARIHGGGDLRIDDVSPPEPAPGEALIRVTACGVCPSDVRAYSGARGNSSNLPRTPGHEWTGVITSLDAETSAATGFAVGDRVVPDWRVVCGRCHYCRRGVFNYCRDLGHIRGGFAEWGTAAATNLRRIPDCVKDEEAIFTEPLACCINGSMESRISLGDDVVIVGAGPIGLQHMQLARAQGARVIVSDPLASRLEVAQRLGAHDVIDVSQGDPVQRVLELTDGLGANTVIVAVGHPTPLNQGLRMAGINGAVNFFAGTYPPTELAVDPNLIHYKQLVVTGSHDFTPHDFTTALRLIEHKIVQVAPLISHRFSLDQTKEAFDLVANRGGMKAVVLMN